MSNAIKDSLEFYNFDEMFNFLTNEEMRTVGWRLNSAPRDDYEFPIHKNIEEPCIVLNKEFEESDFKIQGLINNLLNRKSTLLNELDTPWDFSDLEKLLVLSAGCRDEERYYPRKDKFIKISLRTYPSGGALYPVKTYFYANRIKGLESGFYYFDAVDNAICKINDAVSLEELEGLFPMSSLKLDKRSNSLDQSAAIIFMVADYKYNFRKYGQLSYRLTLLEAGHMTQNMQLISTALGKNSLPICGLYPEKVEEVLGIRKNKYKHCIYGIVLG